MRESVDVVRGLGVVVVALDRLPAGPFEVVAVDVVDGLEVAVRRQHVAWALHDLEVIEPSLQAHSLAFPEHRNLSEPALERLGEVRVAEDRLRPFSDAVVLIGLEHDPVEESGTGFGLLGDHALLPRRQRVVDGGTSQKHLVERILALQDELVQRMTEDEMLLVLAPRPIWVHRRLEPVIARVHGQLADVAGAQPWIVQIRGERKTEVKTEVDECVCHLAATPSAHAAITNERIMQTKALRFTSFNLASSRNAPAAIANIRDTNSTSVAMSAWIMARS